MAGERPETALLEEHLGKRKPDGATARAEGLAHAARLGALARGYAAAVEESTRLRAEEQLTPQALARMVEGVALVCPETAVAFEALRSLAAFVPETQGPRWPLRLCTGGADALRAALAGTTPGATLLLVERGQEALQAACAGAGFAGPAEALPSLGEVASLFAPEVLRLATLAGLEVELLVLQAAVKAERAAGAPEKSGALQLGALLLGLGARGVQTVSLVVPAALVPLARWLETLAMRLPGRLPRLVLEDAILGPSAYGDERLFIELRLAGEEPDPRLRKLNAAGLSTVQVTAAPEGLIDEVVRWELSLAFAAGAQQWPPFSSLPEPADTALPGEPALRDGPLALYASPSHAFVLRKVAGTLGPKAASSAPHWLAAQLALGGPGDLASFHCNALPTGALREALPRLQAAVRGATGLATRVRLGLAGLGPQAHARTAGGEGTLLFLLSDGGGAELDLAAEEGATGPAALLRREEAATLAACAAKGRAALLLRAEDGDRAALVDAALAAATLLSKPR